MIGAGPRGICVLERVLANHTGGELVVHVVDPFVHRGSRVWSVDQPPSLLMNTVTSQVTVFTDESVRCAGPILPGPSLYEWAKALPDDVGQRVREEAARLGPDSYPSRAFYGEYLRWALRSLCASAPDGVTVRLHEVSALALDEDTAGLQTVVLADGTRLGGLAAVVLAQGHLDMPLTGESRRLGTFVARQVRYLPPANPAEVGEDLARIPPGGAVALRGLGLNFFDYLTLLTQGRGGRFERDGDQLRYVRSGAEPVLYAGSRRGIPYHARGENQKGVSGRHEPLFLTPEVIARLRAGRPVDFRAEVWPLISREVRAVYYSTLLRSRGHPDFLRRYRELPESGEDELLREYGIGAGERWNWDVIAHPDRGRGFGSHEEFRAWLLDHLRRDLAEARLGNVDSPLKAALDVLRDLRNEVRLVVDHGGVTGDSYRRDLQDWYTPLNAFLSIGPPARRVAELIALVEAGVLRPLGPGMRVDIAPDRRAFVVGASSVDAPPVRVTTLVEARLPEFDVRRSADPLARLLLNSGQCRPYGLPRTRGGAYETGGLAVTPRPYHLLDRWKRPHPRRFAYGVPTETVHWVTAAGVRPDVDSVILGDADAIARAVLAVVGNGKSAPAGEKVEQAN
ncbi:FAD/NAD(P)-binding protein [Amycolatopsis bartoniae]|nr:FAD/NAD(P)-binding protein [Amycolatopsis bartoniae]